MLARYSHADGGTYVVMDDHAAQMKMPNGQWVPAVIFRRVERGPTGKWQYTNKNQLVVPKAQWAKRYTLCEDEPV